MRPSDTFPTARQRRARSVRGGLGIVAMLASCRPAPPPAQDTGPEDAALSGPSWSVPDLGRLADVALVPVEADPALPRGKEIAGLATALLELGLADLDGVIPTVEGGAVSPGLSAAPHEGAERWSLRGQVREQPGALELVVSLCSQAGSCEEIHSARGTRAEPTPSVADVLDGVAGRLLRPRREDVAADQATVLSIDPYAVLLAGRAAATWYGLLPENPRNDALKKALRVDPDTAVGNWIAGRRALGEGNLEQAHGRFVRAAFARPSSVLLLADQAAALDAAGKAESALATWLAVDAARPADPRFQIAIAKAAMAAGKPQDAETRLASLAPEIRDALGVVRLRVAAAEAAGRANTTVYDALLARWAELVPEDTEPVRRRIQWRVHAGRYAEALPFAEALVTAGRDPQARAVLTALHAANGDWDKAASTAEGVLANRLRARGADPARRAVLLAADTDPLAQAVRAEALLADQHPAAALESADAALAGNSHLPEALGARRDALTALGRIAERDTTQRTLRWLDPGFDQGRPGPSTSPGSTGAGAHPQVDAP